MFARRHYLTAAAVLALGYACSATAADAAGIFTLKSTTFQDGKMMPKKVANSKANAPTNPNCTCRRSFHGPTYPRAPRALF